MTGPTIDRARTTGQPAGTLDGPPGYVHAAVFSPGGRMLDSAGHDGAIKLWGAVPEE